MRAEGPPVQVWLFRPGAFCADGGRRADERGLVQVAGRLRGDHKDDQDGDSVMSFFGTLFGGEAEQEAADKNRALLSQYGQTGNTALDTGLTSSTGALNTGANAAAGYLGQNRDIYGNLLS